MRRAGWLRAGLGKGSAEQRAARRVGDVLYGCRNWGGLSMECLGVLKLVVKSRRTVWGGGEVDGRGKG